MSSDPQSVVAFPLDIGSTIAEEFLVHPDFRVIAAFLLGWVFWSGISHACRSQFFQVLGRLCWNFFRNPHAPSNSSDIEARASQHQDVEKNPQRRRGQLSAIHHITNEAALTFTLNLCFAFAGFAQFCSLLVYDPNGDTACAFTIAWGSMAAQAARLIGLVILLLTLHNRGASKMEFYALCAALVVGLSFILAYTATNTGGVVPVRTLRLFVCNRTPWIATALLSSIGFIILELYMIVRFLGWDVRKNGFWAMLARSANLQVARACSMLLLDLLTVVPNASNTNVLAQFIPLSVGILVVQGVFNYSFHDRLSSSGSRATPPLPFSHPVSLPPPPPVSTPRSARQPPIGQARSTPPTSPPVFTPDDGILVISSPELPPSTVTQVSERKQVEVPSSAPLRIGDASVFADHQTRQILPFQVQYAEHLERHVHTGPVVVPHRSRPQRPHVQVVIEDMEPPERSRTMPLSIIGSDIVRMASAATASSRKGWSPETYATPSEYTVSRSSSAGTPTTHTPTTTRDSTLTMLSPAHTRSLSSGSRKILSPAASRHPSRRKHRSPAEGLNKLLRLAPRGSMASGRTFGGAREELSIVVEGQMESLSASHRNSRGSTPASKQLVISRPHSLRASRHSSPQPSLLGKQLPTISANSRPSSAQHLTVPEHRRSPIGLPASPASFNSSLPTVLPLPPSPPAGGYERALGSGRLRGPRSPPLSSSVPNLASDSGATEFGQLVTHVGQGRLSGSCPELPPLDLGLATLRNVPSTRQ
ncbi:hypothetical protein C8Q80DRAFT_1098745 [Daedaleopsis nitida]|nr:hypothetical protein C8Q80DRAFT_1098745 [Daedaleopsis nitida]